MTRKWKECGGGRCAERRNSSRTTDLIRKETCSYPGEGLQGLAQRLSKQNHRRHLELVAQQRLCDRVIDPSLHVYVYV